MLPDFPKVRELANGILMNWFQRRVWQKTGIMKEMRKEVMHEGNKVELQRYDGSVQKVSMKPTGSELTIEIEEFKRGGTRAIIEAMDHTATNIARKQTKSFFQGLDEIIKQTGYKVDAKGRPFSYDVLLDVLEKLDIDFDERGQPEMPSVVIPPDFIDKIKKMQITNEQQKRHDELIERKRTEWRERESDRKLVN